MKCIECGSEDIEIIEEEGREKYICGNDHKNTRMIKNRGLVHRKEEGETVHESVGAIIISDSGYLLLKRRKYPYKYSIPAGHLEEGEEPDNAVLREIREETGLDLDKSSAELVFEGKIKDKCRRGADYHDWDLYLINLSDGEVTLDSNDEAQYLEWVSAENLDDIEATAPVKEFLIEKDIVED